MNLRTLLVFFGILKIYLFFFYFLTLFSLTSRDPWDQFFLNFYLFPINFRSFIATWKKLGGCSFYKCLIFALKKGFLLVFWSFERRKLAISRTVGRRELGGAAFESSPQDAF